MLEAGREGGPAGLSVSSGTRRQFPWFFILSFLVFEKLLSSVFRTPNETNNGRRCQDNGKAPGSRQEATVQATSRFEEPFQGFGSDPGMSAVLLYRLGRFILMWRRTS